MRVEESDGWGREEEKSMAEEGDEVVIYGQEQLKGTWGRGRVRM
jgi:hypothetical protein